MSRFKVEFTLKQHTPIIHFQSSQSGATLRATELKPKFDRFLKEYAFGGDIPDIYRVDKSRDALNYRVKIEPNTSQAKEIDDRNPLFFGNMGDGKKKKFKENNKNFKIEFFSFNKLILEAIENKFEAFLANTNFGTRQSKGFGSFYIVDREFDKNLIPYKVYSFSTKNWQRDIGLLYQFLRQGINLKDRNDNTIFYSKPAIFSYAKSKNWQWDKKSIKERYFPRELQSQIEEHNSDILTFSSEDKYLLRDLFGLSSSQKWMSYNRTIEKKDIKKDEKNNPIIERFKSPITFKVVDNRVYFWANDSIDRILNQTFNIKAGSGKDSLNLSTPKIFNFDDFFAFTFKINLSIHINSKFHNTDEYKNLTTILDQLKVK